LTSRFILGQYKPSDSLGHRLDPRAKILMALILMILALFNSSPVYYLCLCLGLLILIQLSAISLKTLLGNLRPFVILISITALYHLIFSARETATLVEFIGLRLTRGGVYMALVFSLRLMVFVGVAFFVSLTTMPSDMAETLVGWLKPFRRLGLPADDIGLIVFIAMRFIPVLAEEFDTIRKAQIVRGVDFSGSLIRRSRRLAYLLIPVFQAAVRRADDLALAIESRGYISGGRRSSLKAFHFNGADWAFMILSILIAAGLFVVTGYIWP